jgi:Cu-Zn family superoxide dismutase
MNWRRKLIFLVALVVLIGLPVSSSAGSSSRFASAKMYDVNGQFVGVAILRQTHNDEVSVHVVVRGLTAGLHGIHIHAIGACAPDFSAAGSHFNPTDALHPNHAGDLGNLYANSAGIGWMATTTSNITLTPGPLSLFDADGSALIIHDGPDDLHTHPTGNSGGRVACGVITS